MQYPFSLIHGGGSDGEDSSSDGVFQQQQATIDVRSSLLLTIQFDPKFKKDRFIRTVESRLDISYVDHPSTDWVALRGDVFYPNLMFEVDEVSKVIAVNSSLQQQSGRGEGGEAG